MKLAPLVILLLVTYSTSARADTFGNGANSFNIEFVYIGNANNPDDTTGSPNPAGKVEYDYRIGKYEISEQMIDKANALGGLGIPKDSRGPNKPATSVNWFEAAKFINWLNIDANSTPAYKFDGSGNFRPWGSSDPGYNRNNFYRNSQAKYFLPSVDEWYKAAYYDPNGGVYFDYPTGSNNLPDGFDFVGDPNFDAVFPDGDFNSFDLQPIDVTIMGVLSPYGTAGQGGNVWEWEETDFDLMYSPISGSDSRGIRGGSWAFYRDSLLATIRGSEYPFSERDYIGFRIASITVPEPSTVLLGALASVGVLLRRRCE